MKVVVFDLGGTLMHYTGMPLSWVDFYHKGFEAVNLSLGLHASPSDIDKSVQILRSFNPRINYREVEYSPSYIFEKALEHWTPTMSISICIEAFWKSLNLNAVIYPDTISGMTKLKEKGYRIAALTDLPSAMPDEFFQKDIIDLLKHFDCYVSSAIAGFRKPNPKGLSIIAEQFRIPVTELIFVGDEEKDEKTARNAQCRFIRMNRTRPSSDSIKDLFELLDSI